MRRTWGSASPYRFADRRTAGQALGRDVAGILGTAVAPPLVLGLARGGVPVGREVADLVGGDLDVMVVRKISPPGHAEFGVGAITATGRLTIDEAVVRRLGLDDQALAAEAAREGARARELLLRYRAGRAPPPITGRTVIVVDDGVAAGVTARAALAEVRGQRPSLLVFATPVGAPDSVAGLDADHVVCLWTPRAFRSVSQWYRDFHQTGDDEVIAALGR